MEALNHLLPMCYAVLIPLLIAVIIIRLNKERIDRYFKDLRHTFKIVSIDRSSRFGTFTYSKYPTGVVIGKLPIVGGFVCSAPDREEHLMFVAPSGSGKTTGPVIMTLRSIIGRFHSFVIDVSGDIHPSVPSDKLIFSPFEEERGGLKYDVFYEVDMMTDDDLKNLELQRLTQLIYSDYQPSSAAIYYGEAGETILKAAMIAGYHAGLDFPDICKAVYEKTIDELMKMIELHPYADSLIKEYKHHPDLQKFKQNLNKTVRIFATDPRVSESFGRGSDSISPRSLEDHSVYICIPDKYLQYSKQLMHVITAQVVDYMLARKFDVASRRQPKILLCLDEMTSLGHLGSLRDLLQRTRKHGVRIMILTQDPSDFEMIYPDEWRSMLGNMTIKVVLGGLSERDSMDYISDIVGGYTDDENTYKLYFTPADIRMLSPAKEIVIFNGGHMVINKARWFDEYDDRKEPSPQTYSSGVRYDKFL